ncbi:MFS transporter [Gorillibacterium sp. sgz5001074]|uniref:MFS transporter n=1 Tax=Gorillibacterium sp. sgz5001074 TaxID=3446695 RepID=UPI003F66DD2D
MSQDPLETMDRRLLSVILFVCIIAGTAQGLLLPLLSYLQELRGVSPSMNGLNSAALYVGMMGTSLFVGRPIRRFGYKPVILAGGWTVTVMLALYPLGSSMIYWLLLRLLTGVGITSLHFASQLWIMSATPARLRGRYISMYGMAYGVGFGIGPLGVSLLRFDTALPFAAASLLFAAAMAVIARAGNDRPAPPEQEAKQGGRFLRTLRLALLALVPNALYAFMESMLTASFPIFGQRTGLEADWVGIILFAFVFGSLVLQIPLGVWGDRIGRKKVLMAVMSLGALLFALMPAAAGHPVLLLSLFAAAGAVVGSISSLGMSYGVDLLPKSLLPTLSVLSSLTFGMASIAGPNIGGSVIQYVSPSGMFYVLAAALLGYVLLAAVYRPADALQAANPRQAPGIPGP